MTSQPSIHLSPLVRECHQDAWRAFQALASRPHVIFLDSALRHETLGRYSYVAADPLLFLTWRRGEWRACGPAAGWEQPFLAADPFATLRNLLACFRQETAAGLPPFQGGLAGVWGYDLCHVVERLPRPAWDEFQTPDLAIGAYDWVLAHDHEAGRSWIISTGAGERILGTDEWSAAARLERACSLMEESGRADGHVDRGTGPRFLAPRHPLPGHEHVLSNFTPAAFQAAVAKAIAYVHAGDCFQVNVAQRLLTPLREPLLDLYRRLRERNPATFAGYFHLGDFWILSASPERFVRVDPRGRVETRPIKGTRPRLADPARDRDQVAALRASAKDRAENVMIVDLLRNDLGRACAYGSIEVPSTCVVESYQTVHHLVSVVRGQLAAGKRPLDLLRAAFPGGSVTGAPKVRAMEIIAELEPTARGPYCGALGFAGFDGAMDTNILIRTFTAGRGWLQFPVGGGIVADSVPRHEYEETLHKAEGLLRALTPT